MTVNGRLTGATAGYAGHEVEVFIPALAETEAGAGRLAPTLLRLPVSDDGKFSIDLERRAKLGGPMEITVRAPSGERLAFATQTTLSNFSIKVLPRTPLTVALETTVTDPALGSLKIRIILHDKTEQDRAANQLVSVWGIRADAPAGDPVQNVLGASYADARGVAVIEIPRAAYSSLEIEVPGHQGANKRFPLKLSDEGLPSESASDVLVDLTPAPEPSDEECDCKETTPPRTPDHDELVGSGVFAADPIPGGCVSLAVPNRTIEEYSFHSLVRTTDPYLFNVKPPRSRPRPLSETALNLAAELAYGFSSLDTQLAQGATGTAGPQPSPRGGAVLRSGEAALDQLRLESHTYRSTGLAQARAWRETAGKEKVLSAIMDRASSLSEETLRHALADPDGFTPVTLMTAERQHALEQLEEKASQASPSKGRTPIATGNMPQWDAQPKTYQAATIAHGHLLEWRQVWRADGYSLGDLLYSLPLAPGQKRQIVVVDWNRRETGMRSESRTVAESFSADLSRDRDVAEIVNSTVTESIRAGSSTRNWGGGGGLGLGIPFSGGFFGLGVAGGGGGSDSKAWQNSARSLSASAGQSISDRTQQAATAVRSQRATVVTGRQQSESVSVTAEVVANYNHCHSMTVEYFEVLKHYRVDLELASVQECLFIPLQMTRFDDMKALRWRDPLSRYLRDPNLRGGFDAIERILTGYVDSDFPLARYADEAVTELWGELRVELDIRRPREPREDEDIDDYLNRNWNTWNILFGSGAAARAYDQSIRERALAEKIFADELAPRIARAFADTLQFELWVDNGTPTPEYVPVGADFTMVSDYRAGREHLIAFRCVLPAGLQFSRARIKGVRFTSTLGEITPGSRSILRYIHVSYRNRYNSLALLSPRRLRDEIKAGDAVFVATFALSKAEELNPRQEDLRMRDRLLKHLNEHVEHYHQVIWWLMDPGRRFMLLDGFIAPDSGGRSVASVTENQLISIVGNSFVMPVAPGYVLDPIARNEDDPERPVDLKEAYRPAIPFAPKRISVPTRGVHAEAIIGECNSCEILDNKRFWDWASEPIEEEPTGIQETSTETRRQTPPDTELTPFSAPIVGIQNVPEAPAPTSFADFTKLLAQKDLFKDVTGLEQNQANALGAFQRAMQTASFFGKMAASGAKASMANRRSEDVMKKVNEAVKNGDMSKEDAKTVIGKLFGAMNGETGESDKPLAGQAAVKDALEKVVKGSGEVSVSKNTSDGSQTVDAKFGEKKTASSIDVQLDGVPAVNQVKSQGCWAAAITMLVSFQRKQSIGIETVLAEVGAPYPEKYETNTGIKPSEIAPLKEAFHLRDASIGALTPESLARQLSERGPLWIAVDDDPSQEFSAHARVITGIKGNTVRFIDPDGGVEDEAEFSVLISQLDELSKGVRSAFGGYAPLILSL